MDRMRKEEIRRAVEKIRKQQLRWFGHPVGMYAERIAKTIW